MCQTVNLKDTGSNPVLSANSKTKGDVGEITAVLWFLENGYSVSLPVGDNCAYDMIVDDGEKLQKVQVKSRKSNKDVIRVEMKSSMRGYAHKYNEQDFDLLFIYDYATKRKALVGWDTMSNKTEVRLRMSSSFNDFEVC